MHAAFEFLHVVDVLHPLHIDIAQQHDALDLARDRRGELRLARCIDLFSAVVEHILDLLVCHLAELFGRVAQILLRCQPAEEVVAQALEIPVVMDLFINKITVNGGIDRLLDHVLDDAADILAVKHLVAL